MRHAKLNLRSNRWATLALGAALLGAGAFGCGDSDASASSGGGAPSTPRGPGAVGVGQGGAQDLGRFRGILESGGVPARETLDDVGFFAEHKLDYPAAECGEAVCIHGLLGVAGNFITGSNCTLLQIGLNSPLDPAALPRRPLDVVLAVDVSGSMRGQPLDFLKLGLRRMLDGLDAADTVSLVTYEDLARLELDAVAADDQETLAAAFLGLEAGGGTNLYDGLFVALEQAQALRAPDREARVIFLSDGVATAGMTEDGRVVALAEAYARLGIGITTIGVGSDFDVQLMRRVGEVGAGNFYYLEDVAAVEEVFIEEVSVFLQPVALEVEIDVVAGDGYRMRAAYGTNGWRGGLRGGEVRLPALFLAGRRRAASPVEGGRRGGGGGILVELMPEAGDLGALEAPERVAHLVLRYTDALSGARVEQVVAVDNPFAPGVIPTAGHFSHPTADKGFVMLNVLRGFEIAMDLVADGDPGSALATLQALGGAVDGWLAGRPDGEPDIEADRLLIAQFAQNLAARGATTPVREQAAPPPEPWPFD